MFTLGLIPSFFRNFFLTWGFAPQLFGLGTGYINGIFVLGGLALSHPFEYARVKLQAEERSAWFGKSWNLMKHTYNAEGLSGLYKGFVPRTLFSLPLMLAVINSPSLDPTNANRSFINHYNFLNEQYEGMDLTKKEI